MGRESSGRVQGEFRESSGSRSLVFWGPRDLPNSRMLCSLGIMDLSNMDLLNLVGPLVFADAGGGKYITSKWQCFRPCLPNWLSCQRQNDRRFVKKQYSIFNLLIRHTKPFFPQPAAIGIKQDSPVCFSQVLWHQRHPGRLPKMDEARKT